MKLFITAFFMFCSMVLLPAIGKSNPITVSEENDEQLLSIVLTLKTDVNCFGDDNGVILVTALGGLAPYVYAWSNGNVGPLNANLSAGVYTVTVTDQLGATANLSVTIDEPDELELDVTAKVDVTCQNLFGSATVSATGGSGSSLIVWSNGQLGPEATNLVAGVYTATATDDNGCITVETVTIEANITIPDVNIDLSADLQVDCGSPTVNLDASSSASGLGITYLWTTVNGHIVSGSNSSIAVVDQAGIYVLLVTDEDNGCSNTLSVTVTGNVSLPTVNINAGAGVDLQIDCLTPEITLNGTGSASGLGIVYLWTTVDGHIVAGANTLNNVVVDASGTYTLRVTDLGTGCSSTASVNVTANIQRPQVSIAAGVNVDLQLDCQSPQLTIDGSGSASGSSISYLWLTLDGHIVSGSNTNKAVVDAAGTYTLLVSNSDNGCSASISVVVTANIQLPTANVTVTGQLGCANSTLVLNTGGSSQGSNFIYLLTTVDGHIVAGENTLTPTVNAAGTYRLIVTNTQNNCISSSTVVVTGQPTLNISLTGVVNVSCSGLLNGAANISVTGGTAPYTYAWSNGMTTSAVSGVAAGLYIVTVSDASGCKGVVNVTIGTTNQINANVTTTAASDPNANNGSASIVVTGGTAPYTYTWSNGMTGSTVSGLDAGTYTVVISDASGCQITVNVIIGDNSNCSLTVNVTVQNGTCNQSNGQATTTVANASGIVTYAWSNGMTTSTISNVAAGSYVVIVTDALGCSAAGVAIIHSNDNTPPTVITQDVTLNLDANCSASLTTNMVNNGSSDACGSVTLSLNQQAFNGSQIGTQVVVLRATDQSGNSATATATVTIVDDTPPTLVCPANMTVNTGGTATTFPNPTIQDNCGTGSANIIFTGGLPSGSIFPQGTTTVSFIAVGSGGFSAVCDFTVDVLTSSFVVDLNLDTPSCPGEADGSITVNASGGIAPLSYFWLNANGQTGPTATGLKSGPYTVLIIDGAGNVMIQSVFLPDPAGLNISMALIMDNCNGTGSIDVTVTGGTAPYTYAWYDVNGNVFATTEDLGTVPSGTYTLVVTDASGCTFNSGVITVNLSTGVIEAEYNSFGQVSISPNPTSNGLVSLDLNLPQVSSVRVEMYNANGQQVGDIVQQDNVQVSKLSLNLAPFPPGQYLVKVITAQHTFLKKVIFVD